MREYLEPFLELLCTMAPYLLLGFFVAGVLHAFLPQRFYAGYLAGNDFRAVAAAALFGVPLPLCSCGVIPTAMSMRRAGASRAATVSFLISTPQTGVDSVLATGALLGLPFALLRPAAALLTALAGGWATGRLVADTAAEAPVAMADAERPHGWRAKWAEALRYGFVDMIRDIGRWLVVGLLLAGAITIAVPDGFLASLGDRPLAGMLAVLLLSAPMYLCATGSVPIAAALMLKGLSPGAALVLLMAGPATNMAAMLVIGKVLGRRTLAVYLASIAAGAIGIGLAIDYLLPAAWFRLPAATLSPTCCGAEGIAWWQAVSGGVFVALLLAAFFRRKKESLHEKKDSMEEKTYRIEGMMCNHCKANVQRNIAALPGVESVEVDLDAGIARVRGAVPAERVEELVRQLGYTCREA